MGVRIATVIQESRQIDIYTDIKGCPAAIIKRSLYNFLGSPVTDIFGESGAQALKGGC